MKDILIAIAGLTGERFAEVVDGVVTDIETNEVIPLDLMMYQRAPKDGLYGLGEATCDDECSIGVPKPKCVKKGMYSKRKCSVYSCSDLIYTTLNPFEIRGALHSMNRKQI